jgi:hypothetical protein
MQHVDSGAWLSLSEAGRRAGLSAGRVRQLADAGDLTCWRSPLGRLVAAEDVETLRIERAGRHGVTPAPAIVTSAASP